MEEYVGVMNGGSILGIVLVTSFLASAVAIDVGMSRPPASRAR